MQFVEHEIALLEERLEDIGRPRPELSQAVDRWDTIPGVDRVAAWALLAEVGDDMAQFPTAEQLASWAALCPGNHESANACAVQLVKGAHGCAAWLVNAPGLPREPRILTCPLSSVQTLSREAWQEKSHHHF